MELKAVNNLKVNVYATLAYFDVFDYPLKIDELERYLLWAKAERNVLWTFLNNDPNIQRNGDHYFFRGRREIVETRKERERIAGELWKRVTRYAPLLKAVPFVQMAAVCNSLAINNTGAGSDIDLFIVAKKGRLFAARTFATLLLTLLGVRRHGKKVDRRFCLSFFVTDESLGLEGIRNGGEDIYLPYWILTLKPLFGREIYERILEENRWVEKYFPMRDLKTDERTLMKEGGFLKKVAGLKEKMLSGKIGDRLEKWLSDKHMERHQRRIGSLGPEASVVISPSMLKFHNLDRRKEIAQRFASRFEAVMQNVG
jgi:hypothetical protein